MTTSPATTTSLAPAAEVFAVRPFEAPDIAFVRDSWLRSSWNDQDLALRDAGESPARRKQRGAIWYAEHRPRVTRLLLGDEPVTVLVACDREDAHHLGAWLAAYQGSAIYAYSKLAYRGWGLVTMLADAAGVPWGRHGHQAG
jgi:hypothetical protein